MFRRIWFLFKLIALTSAHHKKQATRQDDMFDTWHIDRHAWNYFGILRFTDDPGRFPQLDLNQEWAEKKKWDA
jgi:hypothetical protein